MDPSTFVAGNLPIERFVQNAIELGSSHEAVLICLLLRGNVQLRTRYEAKIRWLENNIRTVEEKAAKLEKNGVKAEKKVQGHEANLMAMYDELYTAALNLLKLKHLEGGEKNGEIIKQQAALLDIIGHSIQRTH